MKDEQFNELIENVKFWSKHARVDTKSGHVKTDAEMYEEFKTKRIPFYLEKYPELGYTQDSKIWDDIFEHSAKTKEPCTVMDNILIYGVSSFIILFPLVAIGYVTLKLFGVI